MSRAREAGGGGVAGSREPSYYPGMNSSPRTNVYAAPALVLGLSVAVVGSALISQHWGGLDPCILCYYQRYPWYAAIGLMALALGLAKLRCARALLLGAVAVLLAANVVLAFYHVGVEHKVFAGPASCASGAIAGGTVDALRAQLTGRKVVRCDEPAFVLFGVSMAGYNLLASAAVALIALRLALRERSAR